MYSTPPRRSTIVQHSSTPGRRRCPSPVCPIPVLLLEKKSSFEDLLRRSPTIVDRSSFLPSSSSRVEDRESFSSRGREPVAAPKVGNRVRSCSPDWALAATSRQGPSPRQAFGPSALQKKVRHLSPPAAAGLPPPSSITSLFSSTRAAPPKNRSIPKQGVLDEYFAMMHSLPTTPTSLRQVPPPGPVSTGSSSDGERRPPPPGPVSTGSSSDGERRRPAVPSAAGSRPTSREAARSQPSKGGEESRMVHGGALPSQHASGGASSGVPGRPEGGTIFAPPGGTAMMKFASPNQFLKNGVQLAGNTPGSAFLSAGSAASPAPDHGAPGPMIGSRRGGAAKSTPDSASDYVSGGVPLKGPLTKPSSVYQLVGSQLAQSRERLCCNKVKRFPSSGPTNHGGARGRRGGGGGTKRGGGYSHESWSAFP